MMCAVCMFDGHRQEHLIDLKDGQIDELRAELDAARELLRELTALVRGECPSLLNEDSGGDANLALSIDDALKEGGK